jgi:catechol 2,3-dioxygenase-like lactoylglutathione lyase family enzyme
VQQREEPDMVDDNPTGQTVQPEADSVGIDRFDHFVLTVADIDRTVDFYRRALGMEPRTSETGRVALHFGDAKINLHQVGHEISPHASHPQPGSADLCLTTRLTPSKLAERIEHLAVEVELGPVTRAGVRGPITSFYIRDPDDNLVEIATYADDSDT